MWRTFQSKYKYFSCQSSYLYQYHYRKENISVGGSEQRRDALFKIHLRETWLELFRLLKMYLSFSTFIFSTGIKLFIRHPVVLFSILILTEQFDGLVQLHPWCILRERQLYLHKYVKYWVLYPIIAQAKRIMISDMALTRIRLLL